jgi:hypothetical protein
MLRSRRNHGCLVSAALLLALSLGVSAQSTAAKPRSSETNALPHLAVRHGATQIIVDGKPFLVRGGELENSSASSLPYLDKLWPKFVAMHFNTVIAPVYWQLIEPREGHFDFTTVDGLVHGARAHHMHLVLLWFGSWKNSVSCYVPDWVKENQQRFPRAELPDGRGLEILSSFSKRNLDADTAAFVALMKHVRVIDSVQHTVLMVQVENEIGMIPKDRDYSPAATAAFNAPVPAALTGYMAAHRDMLAPALRKAWEDHGSKSGANWTDTFGDGPLTDDVFDAWTEAQYTGAVAAAGKAVDPLPMYVNAALIPGGGRPLPGLFDVWHAAAPAIDLLSPDIYFPNFKEWADRYATPGNPLFIPESGRADASQLGADGFYAYAQLNAMGFSVYAPENLSADDQKTLGQAYEVLDQLTPLILAHQGTGHLIGILTPTFFTGKEDLSSQTLTLGGYTFTATFHRGWPPATPGHPAPPIPGAHGGLILQLGPNDFLVAGTGMIVTFGVAGSNQEQAGIDDIWEGEFVHGVWRPGRNLNGDDDNQGRWLELPAGKFTLRRVKLYRYR